MTSDLSASSVILTKVFYIKSGSSTNVRSDLSIVCVCGECFAISFYHVYYIFYYQSNYNGDISSGLSLDVYTYRCVYELNSHTVL